jgi:predicted nuclease of restriction endonuclease-like RecB superfamily
LLTADLVNARRQGRDLRVIPLDAHARARATELAAIFLDIARGHVGRSREEFEEACAAVEAGPRERRLADGLCKLIEDRCEFDAEALVDPEELRREVFLRASAARRGGPLNRRSIVEVVAKERELTTDALEHALYADLRGAHLLKGVEPIGPARLVDEYDLAQAQAVLLRAVRVVVDVECRTPGAYRALFHKLKFLRLLYTIQPRREGGYRIELDGPFSLFESVTKYGLQLALALPAVRECDAFRLEADVRWGKERVPLTFRLEGQQRASAAGDEQPRLADEVARLVEDLRAIETPWKVSSSTDILSLPGVGLCVPDLVFHHQATGECVYLEVLGFWSREAVWRRVELVERGLGERILFAVSKHLRVSEAVLGEELPGALYVYKRVMSARSVLERVEALARRATELA